MINPEPKPGDILLFSKPRRSRDYLIKWVTHSPFYHVALYAGDGNVIEARPPVVALHNLQGREEGVVVVAAPEGKGAAALKCAEAHLGEKFDELDMYVILLDHLLDRHIKYNPDNKFSCAELVAAAYREAGVNLFPWKHLDEIVPGDFAELQPNAAQPAGAAQGAIS